MTISLIPGAVVPPAMPSRKVRCQHSVVMADGFATRWRDDVVKRKVRSYAGSERVDQCTRHAVVELDGVPMCRRHAGQEVLNLYLAGDLVKR